MSWAGATAYCRRYQSPHVLDEIARRCSQPPPPLDGVTGELDALVAALPAKDPAAPPR
ncbi:hypothetical protein F4557_000521 [Actinomadura catellatispora]|uniref:Uncharacterized protein n=1 Tax=Actinomadura livida TaxID=79909 RepID=A0A7W7MV19_9ACTN|nr:hypothetical protein [Actinomadura catellatispora]